MGARCHGQDNKVFFKIWQLGVSSSGRGQAWVGIEYI